MAEYLDPRDGYALVTLPDWQAPQPWWIEVPEGAEIYGYPTSSTLPYFHKTIDGQNWYYSSMNHNWSTSGHPIGAFDCVIWQRATQPEELPFIDDEPPAHFVVRPKPRERVYAVLGERVQTSSNVNIKLSIDSKEFSEACNGSAKAIGKAVRQFNEAMRLNRLG